MNTKSLITLALYHIHALEVLAKEIDCIDESYLEVMEEALLKEERKQSYT